MYIRTTIKMKKKKNEKGKGRSVRKKEVNAIYRRIQWMRVETDRGPGLTAV